MQWYHVISRQLWFLFVLQWCTWRCRFCSWWSLCWCRRRSRCRWFRHMLLRRQKHDMLPADVSVNSCFATELELQQSHKDLFWSWTPRKLKGSIHMHLTYLARKPSTGPATSKRAVDAVEDLPWAVWRKLRLTIRGSQEQRRSRCLTIRRNGHNENWFQAFVWDWPLLFYEPCFHDSRKPENPLENSTSESHQGDQSCFEKFYTS